MTPEERKLLVDTAAAVKRIEASMARKPWTYVGPGDPPGDMHQVIKTIAAGVKAINATGLTEAQLAAIKKVLLDGMSERMKS